jgi:hypothetical protein
MEKNNGVKRLSRILMEVMEFKNNISPASYIVRNRLT